MGGGEGEPALKMFEFHSCFPQEENLQPEMPSIELAPLLH